MCLWAKCWMGDGLGDTQMVICFPWILVYEVQEMEKEEKHATKWILYKILISDKIPLSNKMMWFGQKNNFWIKWKKINKFFIINLYNHELVQRLLDGLRLNGNVWGPKVDLLQRPLNLLSPLWSAFELALTPLAHFGQAWNVILRTTVIWLSALSSSKFFLAVKVLPVNSWKKT